MSAHYVNTVRVCCSSPCLPAARLTIRISLSFQVDEAYLVSTCANFSTTALQGCPHGRGSSLLSLQPVSTRLKHRITYIRASPTSKLDDRALACWTVRFDSDSNVCGAAVLFFEFLPDLVVSERGKAEREIRYVLAVSTLLIQQGRKKLCIQVGRQQIQQLPRLACLSLPKSGNINKN